MKDILEMIADLEEFYECAGFADFYERVLKDMSEEKVVAYYNQTFAGYDPETDTWENPDVGFQDNDTKEEA